MDIKKLLCAEMHKFVKNNIDKVESKLDFWGRPQRYIDLGFKNRADMLKQIKNDHEVAVWALQELLSWGMDKNYCQNLYVEEVGEDMTIYKLNDKNGERYFTTDYDKESKTTFVNELIREAKVVTINEWKFL